MHSCLLVNRKLKKIFDTESYFISDISDILLTISFCISDIITDLCFLFGSLVVLPLLLLRLSNEDLRMVHSFVCEESQELWTVYDYKVLNTQTRFKAKRNGFPVLLQILPLPKHVSFKSDLEQWKLCQGLSESSLESNIDISFVLVEKLEGEIIYRSRDCLQLVHEDGDGVCTECNKLVTVSKASDDFQPDLKVKDDLEGEEIKDIEEGELPVKEEENEGEEENGEKDDNDDDWNPEASVIRFKSEDVPRRFKPRSERNVGSRPGLMFKSLAPGSELSKAHYVCFFCGNVFLNEESFRKHEEESHKIDTNFKCPGCDYADEVKQNVMKHIRDSFDSHDQEFRDIYGQHPNHFICPQVQCEEAFYRKATLDVHLRNAHKRDIPLNICPICEKKVSYVVQMSKHMATHHQSGIIKCIQNGFLCEDLTFQTFEEQRLHDQNFHTPKDINTCHHCGATYKKGKHAHFIRHVLSHELTEKKYACNKCDEKFLFKVDLNAHQNTKCNIQALCPHCPKMYTQLSSLASHIQHKHSDKKFNCEICGKEFNAAFKLKYHMRTHTGEKPFTCKFCSKSFKSSGNLDAHVRLHTGDLIYCQFCNKGFAQKYNLKLHIDKHHSS